MSIITLDPLQEVGGCVETDEIHGNLFQKGTIGL